MGGCIQISNNREIFVITVFCDNYSFSRWCRIMFLIEKVVMPSLLSISESRTQNFIQYNYEDVYIITYLKYNLHMIVD